MKTKLVVALSLFVGFCTVAPSARAEAPKGKGDVEYKFDDDGLLGKELAGQMQTITPRGKGRRDLLHRPRLQFVQEMLKSVENM